ncbi:MAG: glutamate ABC transporter substrate-binding protein [Pseudonocardiaceae bacterium]
MITRAGRTACLVAALAFPAAACQGSVAAPEVPVSASPSVVNQPAQQPPAQQQPTLRQPDQQQPSPSCDRRASLRPLDPLPEPGLMPPGSTMARIVERGRLIAGVDQNTYLFGFRNPLGGQLEGFDTDIVHDLAEAILGDRDKVEYKVVFVSDRVRVVEEGTVDLVVSTMTITCERRERVEFSIVYFDAGQRVLVNDGSTVTGISDLGGKRVCAARGSTSLQNVFRDPSRPVPVGMPNASDCLVLLQLGKVDAISTDDALLAGFADQDPRTKIVGERFSSEPYGIAISRNSPDLVRFVNAVLEQRMRDGRWQASFERWLTRLAGLGESAGIPQPPQPRYRD